MHKDSGWPAGLYSFGSVWGTYSLTGQLCVALRDLNLSLNQLWSIVFVSEYSYFLLKITLGKCHSTREGAGIAALATTKAACYKTSSSFEA